MPPRLVTRFAPSPTGYLHLGHAFSAILNHDVARARGGRFMLRIEDIDQGRARPAFEKAIFDDLAWLGLSWDEPVLRQSERFSVYEAALHDLMKRGLLYRCFLTRAERAKLLAAPHSGDRGPPAEAPLKSAEAAERLASGQPFALRLDMAAARRTVGAASLPYKLVGEDGASKDAAASLSGLEDPVLGRKDFPASYHLASVVDDESQGITHIWRGADLEEALPLHRLLQELLGFRPPTYRHHRLITDEKGRRLAKRDQAQTLRALKEAGETPRSVRRRLGIDP